jgi:rhodanese-related sulfurtransferase
MKHFSFCLWKPVLFLLLVILPGMLAGCAYVTGEAVTITTPAARATPQPSTAAVIITVTPQPSPPAVKNVTPEEAYRLLSLSSKWVHIIDVRTPQEYAEGHLAGAENIDFNSADFKEKVAKLDKNIPYIVYCRSGSRSAAASKIMAELGFSEIYNMTGGFTDWQAAGFPVAK